MTVPAAIELKRADFDYPLPPELIAQEPLPVRSDSRLLLLDAQRGVWRDLHMRQLPELLSAGDLLVFNDTRVLPARLRARKQTGGRIELLLERTLGGARALVQLRASKAVRAGMHVTTTGGAIALVARRGEFWEVELPQETQAFFESYGEVPLPPYIRRPAGDSDRERYQSLFARVPGAVAAPTASLHFDAPLLERLSERKISRAYLTLHVGAGTFQPLRSEQIAAHRMHGERYSISAATANEVEQTRAGGGRVIAVGTTVARALESAARGSSALAVGSAETTLFIRPGYRFRLIDALLTNFHLPQSTLLMLVAAFAGRELTLAAYAHAVRERYRFFSYGDAMLIFPNRGGARSPSAPA